MFFHRQWSIAFYFTPRSPMFYRTCSLSIVCLLCIVSVSYGTVPNYLGLLCYCSFTWILSKILSYLLFLLLFLYPIDLFNFFLIRHWFSGRSWCHLLFPAYHADITLYYMLPVQLFFTLSTAFLLNSFLIGKELQLFLPFAFIFTNNTLAFI